jgi:hypothetical protein
MSCPLGMEWLDCQLSEELIGVANLKGTLKDLLKHVKGLKELGLLLFFMLKR